MDSHRKPRLMVVEARYYDDIANALLEGAIRALGDAGAAWDLFTVTGALEIPAAMAMIHDGVAGAGVKYRGAIGLGAVIRGETHHFQIVAGESARALMDLSLRWRKPVTNAILTVDNRVQALARASSDRAGGGLDRGGFAARAALDLIALQDRLASGRPDDAG